MLLGAHQAGDAMTNASRGSEREAFVNAFLGEVLSPQFRFGLGDAIDQKGNRSGQLDVVIEFPFVPSLPIVAGRSPRLYLCEGIAAVIEVKSDIASQWDEVCTTASKLAVLERHYGSGISIGPRAGPKVPLYAVGYTGWSDFNTVKRNVDKASEVSGVLVIDRGHFYGHYNFINGDNKADTYCVQNEGSPMALWGLISCIHHATSMVTSTTKDVPRRYNGGD